MTQEEKEKIDYQIKSKQENFNKEVFEWTKAAYIVILIVFVLLAIVKYVF